MRVYHFVNLKYGLENIRRRRLKVALLDELNDPFENLALDLSTDWVREIVLGVKEEMSAFTGVLCFSRSWHNPVQWSHYADGHRGLCLGFEIAENDLVVPITYVRKRIRVENYYFEEPNRITQEMMFQFLTTKFSHWRYEDEVRLFTTLLDPVESKRALNGRLYFAPFNNQLVLKEVIAGHRSNVTKAELERLTKKMQGVSIKKAALSASRFRVVTQRNNDEW